MTALAEALLAAQRQAVGSLAKAFVAGTISSNELMADLDMIGLRDEVDQALMIHALTVVRDRGGEAPKTTGQTAPKTPEPPSEAQLKYIAKLCDERNLIAPDHVASKEQASTVIEQLKAGTYNADEWTAPF